VSVAAFVSSGEAPRGMLLRSERALLLVGRSHHNDRPMAEVTDGGRRRFAIRFPVSNRSFRMLTFGTGKMVDLVAKANPRLNCLHRLLAWPRGLEADRDQLLNHTARNPSGLSAIETRVVLLAALMGYLKSKRPNEGLASGCWSPISSGKRESGKAPTTDRDGDASFEKSNHRGNRFAFGRANPVQDKLI